MKNQKSKIVSDINVTSLVDVTFVLLIVFIIAAPFMRSGVKVDLPSAISSQPQPHRAILIIVDRAGQAFVNNEKVAIAELGAAVTALRYQSPGLPVLIEGDSQAEYGKIVSVMDAVRVAGIQNVGLVLKTAAAE